MSTFAVDFFEKVLIKILFRNRDLSDKIIPYLAEDLFEDPTNIAVVKAVFDFQDKHDRIPAIGDMRILLDDVAHGEFVDILKLDTSEYSREMILSGAEDFVKQKSVYNTLIDNIEFAKQGDFEGLSELPDRARDALSFSFDTDVGLQLFEKAEHMHNFLNSDDVAIASGIPSFDIKTGGGFHSKALSLFMAECVTKDTKIRIRKRKKM